MFVKIEQAPMKKAESELRTQISSSRTTFLQDVLSAQHDNHLDLTYLSEQLVHYEKAVQKAVENNLQMENTNGSFTDPETFPVQSEKWTLMQAIFFASTICTTIGKLSFNFCSSIK